jgi:hypothetical protein
MDRAKLSLDPDDERLWGVVRHMFFVGGLSLRQVVDELVSMQVFDWRGDAFPRSLVWTIVHFDRAGIQKVQ